MKQCKECGRDYEPKPIGSCCSDECRQAHKRYLLDYEPSEWGIEYDYTAEGAVC